MTFKKNNLVINALLILSISLENLFLYYSYANGWLSQSKNAKALFFTSIIFGIILLYKFYDARIDETAQPPKKLPKLTYILLPVFSLLLIILGFSYHALFIQHPIDARQSDIIPLIQVGCRRFLNGEYPYKPISDFGYMLPLTYLPMQWMPYLVAEAMHFDYRWVAYVIWAIAALVLLFRTARIESLFLRIFIPFLVLCSNYLIFKNNPGTIYLTVELMVAGYYILFISGLNQKNAIVQGIFVSLCLLSRYSLIFWLPLAAFVLFVSGHKKELFKTSFAVLVMVLIFYVLPFLSKDWTIFYQGYKYYDTSALGEWNSLDGDHPLHIYGGVGFAYIFYYKFSNLPIPERIKLLQKTHMLVCISSVIIMGIWYWFKRKNIHYKIFMLASFKIYLSFFLAFIQVPYDYLMIVGNFVSIAILCEQARYRLAYDEQ